MVNSECFITNLCLQMRDELTIDYQSLDGLAYFETLPIS
jgi:hypothetical protein